MTTKKILVAGATGRTGQIIIKLLLVKYDVVCLVRNKTSATGVFKTALGTENLPNNLSFVEGNITVAESLKNAVENVDAVVCTTACRHFYFGNDTPYYVDNLGVKNLVNAVVEEEKRRNCKIDFVLISSVSVTKTFHPLYLFIWSYVMGKIGPNKLIGENYLRESGLKYAIVRPARLTNSDPEPEAYFKFTQGDTMGMTTISRYDTAVATVHTLEALMEAKIENVTYEVGSASAPPSNMKSVKHSTTKDQFVGILAKLKRD